MSCRPPGWCGEPIKGQEAWERLEQALEAKAAEDREIQAMLIRYRRYRLDAGLVPGTLDRIPNYVEEGSDDD